LPSCRVWNCSFATEASIERKNPAEFGRRAPNALSAQQIGQLFATIVAPVAETMSDKDFDEAMQRLDELASQLLLKPKEKETDSRPKSPTNGGFFVENNSPPRGSPSSHPTEELSELRDEEPPQGVIIDGISYYPFDGTGTET
jgi:hypothetical protein